MSTYRYNVSIKTESKLHIFKLTWYHKLLIGVIQRDVEV